MSRLTPRGLFLAALALSAGPLAASVWHARATGLVLTVHAGTGFEGEPLLRRHVWDVDLGRVADELPERGLSVRFRGVWHLRRAGEYHLELKAKGHAALSLDGRTVLEGQSGQRAVLARTLALAAGPHAIEVDLDSPGRPILKLRWAPAGRPTRRLDPATLFPEPPGALVLALQRSPLLRGAVAAGWTAPLLVVVGAGLVAGVRRRRALAERLRHGIAGPPGERLVASVRTVARGFVRGLPALIVLYAAALRFGAIVDRYWTPKGPPWAQETRAQLAQLHPSALRFKPPRKPYFGDPQGYLDHARAMRRFYDASVAEPGFVFATKVFLRFVDGKDIAINFASAFFSTLAVLVTYLLGAYAFSRWVGLAAALFFAVERDVVALAADGWRDDCFAFFALLSAYAFLRLRDRPSLGRAVVAGLAGGAAGLTRITSLSFLGPALALLALSARAPARRERLRVVAVAALVVAALVGPFLLNCAVAFGDPFYAINRHTRFYEGRTPGGQWESDMTVLGYFLRRFPPFKLLDTGIVGLTDYPFSNKWVGFDPWSPALGRTLSLCALAGLALFLGSPRGRFLLFMLVFTQLPFAFTWEVRGGATWRLTLFDYPYYLLAAALALETAARLARSPRPRRWLEWARTHRRRLALATGGVAALAALVWGGLVALAYLRVREAALQGQPVLARVGPRDALFFGEGWYPPWPLGNQQVRFSRGREGVLWLPMRGESDYRLDLRVDPFAFDGAAPQMLRVSANGHSVAELRLEWNPKRIGAYSVVLPRTAVRAGRNRIALEAAYATQAAAVAGGAQGLDQDWETAFLLWYVDYAPAGR